MDRDEVNMTRPISSHLDGTCLANNKYIYWPDKQKHARNIFDNENRFINVLNVTTYLYKLGTTER